MIVHIDPMAEQIMTDHAVQSYPSSCSGYLFGTNDVDGKKIFGALAIASINNTNPIGFSNQTEQWAEHYASERNWQLLGKYHSCPDSPAIPECITEDKPLSRNSSQVIISICHSRLQDIRSWVMKSCGQYSEETILAFRQLHTI